MQRTHTIGLILALFGHIAASFGEEAPVPFDDPARAVAAREVAEPQQATSQPLPATAGPTAENRSAAARPDSGSAAGVLPAAGAGEAAAAIDPEADVPAAPDTDAPEAGRPALVLFGTVIPPGERARLSWSPPDTFEGLSAPTPVLVAHGREPGPVLCLMAALHGDEINGVEIVRRVFSDLDTDDLAGALVGVPIVNQVGFRRGSRYLPDRRDLNRYFPGAPNGSSASRIAYSLFNEIVVHCDLLVDVHTGSFQRTNLPQLRADLTMPAVKELAAAFGGMVVVHSDGIPGTLRREASERGVPTVTMEAGEAQRVQVDVVKDSAARIETLMTNLGMHKKMFRWPQREPTYFRSRWLRAERGGLLISYVDLGEEVDPGDRIGIVVDPITSVEYAVESPWEGRIIGMALNQVVRPGYALFHFGISSDDRAANTGIDPGPEDDTELGGMPEAPGQEMFEAEMD